MIQWNPTVEPLNNRHVGDEHFARVQMLPLLRR